MSLKLPIFLFLVMLLQSALLGLFFLDLSQGPTQNLQLFSNTNGLFVSGKSRVFAISSIKHFSSWKQLSVYLSEKKWSLPQPNTATLPSNFSNTTQSTLSFVHNAHTIELSSQNGEKIFLQAPDAESLDQFKNLANYHFLEPSRFGFAVQIQTKEM